MCCDIVSVSHLFVQVKFVKSFLELYAVVTFKRNYFHWKILLWFWVLAFKQCALKSMVKNINDSFAPNVNLIVLFGNAMNNIIENRNTFSDIDFISETHCENVLVFFPLVSHDVTETNRLTIHCLVFLALCYAIWEICHCCQRGVSRRLSSTHYFLFLIITFNYE